MKIIQYLVLGAAVLFLSACGSDSNTYNGGSGSFTATNTTSNTTNPPAGQGGFNFTFTSGGNGNTSSLESSAQIMGTTQATPNSSNPTRLQSSFNQNIISGQTILVRTLNTVIAKTSSLQPGDILTFANPLVTPGAFADYTEQGQPALKRWVSTGGTVTINNITAGAANVTVTNLVLTPAADGGNTASGSITVNGNASLSF